MSSAVPQRLAFLRLDPDNLSLLADLADELILSGRAKEALPHISHALSIAPGHAQFRFRRAVATRRSGDLEGARAELDALLAEGVNDAAVLYERADLALQLSDFSGCLAGTDQIGMLVDYQRLVPATDLLRVRALHHLGRLDEAIAHAEGVLRDDAARNDIRAALATLYLDAERNTDAARMLAEAGAAASQSPELLSVGGYLALAAEETAAAQLRFSEALQRQPEDGRSLLGAGLAMSLGGKVAEAIAYLQRAAEAMPKHLGTLNALAWMQLMDGQLEAADATLERAQSVDSTFSESYGGQAVIRVLRGDATGARHLIRTALKLDRNCFSAAYAGMLLEYGGMDAAAANATLDFLSRHPAPGGGTLKAAVLRLARARGS